MSELDEDYTIADLEYSIEDGIEYVLRRVRRYCDLNNVTLDAAHVDAFIKKHKEYLMNVLTKQHYGRRIDFDQIDSMKEEFDFYTDELRETVECISSYSVAFDTDFDELQENQVHQLLKEDICFHDWDAMRTYR